MSRFRARWALPLITPLLALLVSTAPSEAQQQMATDSISGELIELHEESFVVRAEDGRTMTFEIPSDSAQARREEARDSTDTASEAAHSSYMSRDDIVLALDQIRQSSETDAVHLHYLTDGVPERFVVVWIRVGEPRT